MTDLGQIARLIELGSSEEALEQLKATERTYRQQGNHLKAVQALMMLSQVLLGRGQWRQARQKLDECEILLAALEAENPVDPVLYLQWTQLLAEVTYVGYQQGANNLEELHKVLLRLVEQLEKVRRMRPGAFYTVKLFGELDVYERIVAVAYQLGLVAQAANWTERTKSRRLLDMLLNLPFGQEDDYGR